MRDEMVEGGSIIGDREGCLWRVLEVTPKSVFMLRVKPKSQKNVLHTRTLTWEQYQKFGYDLKFP